MIIKTKYNFFQLVTLKVDEQKKKRMVLGISIRPSGLSYALSTTENETWHYEPEIERIKKTPVVRGFKPDNK